MIAAPMGGVALQQVEVAEYARRGGRVRQVLAADDANVAFSRLAAAGRVRQVSFDATFARSDHGAAMVSGQASAAVDLPCQRCEESVALEIACEFSLTLVEEATANAAPRDDERELRIVEGGQLNLLEMVEDELLLSLPGSPCEDPDCEHAPAMSYPAEAAVPVAPEPGPFAILGQLKDKGDRSDG